MEIEAVEKIFQKNQKNLNHLGLFFGKILVRSDLGKLQASRKKNRKKSEKKAPLTAFVERYLFGEIGNKFRCREGIIGKMEKNQKQRRNFQSFWKDTCSGRSGQNTGLRKEKSKKVRKNQTTFGFSSKILGEGKGVSTMATTIFCKKDQKKFPQWADFWKDTCSETTGISAGL